MISVFDKKLLKPMLLGKASPFNSADYIFELKMDGMRTVAYLWQNETVLINRNGNNVTALFPELHALHKQISATSILDGELIALTNGKPDFFKLMRRIHTSNRLKNFHIANKESVQYVAFDILHFDGRDVTGLPLIERKKLLAQAITQSPRLAVSVYIEEYGTQLFDLARSEGLEGIVAKKKTSAYIQNTRTNNWLKIKIPNYQRPRRDM